MIKNMDFSKYKRFFSFGCSFTDYYWMTWADIIAEEIPENYKYAQIGAGNFYIFQAVVEANIRHKISKDDLVMIMFSNVTREDRFTRKTGWITPGNLYYQDTYDKNFINKFLCHHGCLMRDLNLVDSLSLMLDTLGCNYVFMSMVPFNSLKSDELLMNDVEYLEIFYKETLRKVHPSVLEVVFDRNWNTRPQRPSYSVEWQKEKYIDNHPTPIEHLEYLQKIFPEIKINENTIKKVEEETSKCLDKDFNPRNFSSYKQPSYPRLGVDRRYE